jgi:hypothetical protein
VSDQRAECRRQWRADCKNLKKSIKFRYWTPGHFDKVKARIRAKKLQRMGL